MNSKRNSDGLDVRVQELFDISNLRSERKFAEMIGISLGALKGVLQGSKPTTENLLAIADSCGVTLDWLATGEGPMRGVAAATAPQDAFQTIEIQRYNISLSAGHGNFTDWAEPLDKIPFTQDFFTRRLRRKPENMVIVDANGDSMSPTIADDDLVMIDTKDHSLTGAIWAFSYGESLFIKRLNILPDALEVCSDNSRDYRPFIIDGEKMANVNLIGRVVWVGRSL